MRYLQLATATLAAILLPACAPSPDYVRPPIEVSAHFKETEQWKPAQEPTDLPAAQWWKAFNDSNLDSLQAQVEVNNQNLKVAQAQYRAALATLQSAQSARWPSLSGGVSNTRGSTTSVDSVSVSTSWEVDLWGRLSRTVEIADAKLQASAADLSSARLSMQTLLAQTYMQLRTSDAQLDVYKRLVQSYERFLQLTQNRFALGAASQLEVASAQTQLASAQAQQVALQNQRNQLEHALASLVGKLPAQFSLASDARLPALPKLPTLIPSTLLESRPDIVASERRVAAANAQIGVAKSAYFPILNITGSAGYKGSSFSQLTTAPNKFWSLGPALAMTLLDAGARSAAVDEASANYDQTVATYRQTVLTAFQEVEDNLSSARLLEEESKFQNQQLAAARRSSEIAQNHYQAGTINALNVITAQASELGASLGEANLANRSLQAALQLLKNASPVVLTPVLP